MTASGKPDGDLLDPAVSEGILSLPFKAGQFQEFLRSLLGKPQVIQRRFVNGSFTIQPEHVRSLSDVIHQRITQQNKGTQAAFTAKLLFDDQSAVSFDSVEQLVCYREPKKVVCVGIEVAWTYLIHFQDKPAPEKQVIEVSAATVSSTVPSIAEFDEPVGIVILGSSITLRIQHTARTWGVDIENWLSREIETRIEPFHWFAKWLGRHSGKIATTTALLIMGAGFTSALYASTAFASYLEKAAEQAAQMPMQEQVTFLLGQSAKGMWPRFMFVSLVFLSALGVLAVVAAVVIEAKSVGRPRSFLLFTDETVRKREEYAAKRKRSWLQFGVAVLGSLLLGILGNVLFALCFQRLLPS